MIETKTTNPQLTDLISLLRKQSREQNVAIWRDVSDLLAKTRSQRVTVNLSKIERNTKRADTVVVPGKILASGTLTHPITVASFEASEVAKTKIEAAKAKYISIEELLKKNPSGSNVKIIR
jgi:large subunit ribosomal protein L18e